MKAKKNLIFLLFAIISIICLSLLPAHSCRMMSIIVLNFSNKLEEENLITNILVSGKDSLKKESAKDYKPKPDGFLTFEELCGYCEKYPNQDGWGITAYINGNKLNPDYRSIKPAIEDNNFDSAVNTIIKEHANIILAHIRHASDAKTISIDNTHPFTHNNWSFMHNGTIQLENSNFINNQLKVFKEKYNLYPKSKVDTEKAFYYFLGKMAEKSSLINQPVLSNDEIINCFAQTIIDLSTHSQKLIVDLKSLDNKDTGKILVAPSMNFITTNGKIFLVYRKGRNLFLGRLLENKFKNSCLIISSEPIQITEANQKIIWYEIPENYVLYINTVKSNSGQVKLYPIEYFE